MKQDTFRRFDSQSLKQFRMSQRKLNHLPDLLDHGSQTAYVLVADLGNSADWFLDLSADNTERLCRGQHQTFRDLRVYLPNSNLVINRDSRVVPKIPVYTDNPLSIILFMCRPAQRVRLPLPNNLDDIARGKSEFLDNFRVYSSYSSPHVSLESICDS